MKFLDSEDDRILGDCDDDMADFEDDFNHRKRRKNSDENDVKPALTANKQSNNKLLDKTNGLPSKGSLKETSGSDTEDNKLLKVIVKTSISRINYSDTSVPQKLKHVSTFSLPVRKGYYKTELFYNSMLNQAKQMLKGQAPCESLIKGNSRFFFENPLITYRVVQAQRDEKIWVRYPLNQSLASLEPPTHVTAQVPHAQFFVEYEVAVNGPQVTTPAKLLQPLLPPEEPLQSQEEIPLAPPTLSLAEENMLADMTELANRYPVMAMHIVTTRLAKILHTFRRQRDPALQNLCDEMAKSAPNLKRWRSDIENDDDRNWRTPSNRGHSGSRRGSFDQSRLRGGYYRGNHGKSNYHHDY